MSSVYSFFLVLAVSLAVAGIAWWNSPKARARMRGESWRLFVAIFLLPAPWLVAWPAVKALNAVTRVDVWWIGLAMLAVIVGLMFWLRLPQTLNRAYGPATP